MALAVGASGNTFSDHGMRWIIPARTASMRRSAGRTRRDAVPDTALRQGRQRQSQMTDSTLETVLRRDRWVVGGAIGIIVALASAICSGSPTTWTWAAWT